MSKGNTPRRRKTRDPQATPKALLAAARQLFASRGFDGASIDEVAEAAGVNKALISYHFGGKRALYVAVLEDGFGALAARLVAAEDSAPSARAALEAVGEEFARIASEDPLFPAMYLREVLSSGIEPKVAPHILALVGVSRRILERGVDEGIFEPVHPLSFHFALMGSLIFFFATAPMRKVAAPKIAPQLVQPTAEEFVRHLLDLNLRGLAPDPGAKRRKGGRS